jgi:phosphoribosyl-ATP pyrophosphohydrolase
MPGRAKDPMPRFTLHDLEQRVNERAEARVHASYTRKLLDQGIAHCARKLGEEAIETVLAAVAEDNDRLIGEAADLIYHLLVVLKARGITLADVEAQLAERTRRTGLAEKASRRGRRRPGSDAPGSGKGRSGPRPRL